MIGAIVFNYGGPELGMTLICHLLLLITTFLLFIVVPIIVSYRFKIKWWYILLFTIYYVLIFYALYWRDWYFFTIT